MQEISELPPVSRDTPVWKIPNSVTYAERRRNSPVRRRVRRPSRKRSKSRKSKSAANAYDDADDGSEDDGKSLQQRSQNQRFPVVSANRRASNTIIYYEGDRGSASRVSDRSTLSRFSHSARSMLHREKSRERKIKGQSQSRPQSRTNQETPSQLDCQTSKRKDSIADKADSRNQGPITLDPQLYSNNVSRCDEGRINSSLLGLDYTNGDRKELINSSLTLRLESQLMTKDETEEKEGESRGQDKKTEAVSRIRPVSSSAIVRSRGKSSISQPKSCFGLRSLRHFEGGSFNSIASEELRELGTAKDSDDERESDEFDTDCEPDVNSEFRHHEYVRCMTQHDSDIGHITYELVCEQLKIKPRAKIKQQLREKRLDLHHGALLPPEAKAISSALQANARVEEVDLSYNALPGKALGFIMDVIAVNIYITKLNICGNVIDEDGANACCTMLIKNSWLTELDLSECAIGDNEINLLVQGVQDNRHIHTLNLSKNKIGLTGGLVFGRALGVNEGLRKVDLSWNHIRGGGAVSICNSLKKNSCVEELNLAWNGVGFEGCLALGEALRINRTLRYLNLENNRINWDCAPYLTKALMLNKALEVLVIGQNPISMEGCEDIMMALSKPTSGLKSISFAGIPINTRIALIATDISKTRSFSMDHGGILTTADVIGIHRSRREDPFSLLIRYLSLMGIRVMDLFRMFDKDNKLCVSRSKFIQGLKRVRVPLDDDDILIVAKRLQSNKRGQISYQELATTVRNHIREDRMEDRRQKIIKKKKFEERKRILESGKPLTPSNVNYLPTLYNMYDRSERVSQYKIFSPSLGSFSRRGGFLTPLPLISSERELRLVRSSEGGRRSPSALSRPGKSYLTQSVTFSGHSSVASESGRSSSKKLRDTRSPYVSQLKKQQTNDILSLPRQL